MKRQKIDDRFPSKVMYRTHPCVFERSIAPEPGTAWAVRGPRRLMTYRVELEPLNQRSSTCLCPLDDNWTPMYHLEHHLDFGLPRNEQRMAIEEDCRLFNFCGRVWFNITNRNDTFLGELDWQAHDPKVVGCGILAFPFEVGSTEKNWMFFEQGGLLYGVRWVHAHVVHRIYPDFQKGHAVSEPIVHEYRLDWPHGRPHGGTSPVAIGDEYLSLFQSSKLAAVNGRKDYYVGVYAFEAKPPFRVTRVPKEPLISPLTWPEHSVGFNGHNTFFPLGLARENDTWRVSLGDDRAMWLLEYSTDELLDATKPV